MKMLNSTTSESGTLIQHSASAYQLWQLRPDEIAQRWSVLRLALEQSHPPTTVEKLGWLGRIQARLMSGQMEAWVGGDAYGQPAAVGIFEVVREAGSDTESMLIYSVYAFVNLDLSVWLRWRDNLFEHLRSRGLTQLFAYSDQHEVIDMARRVGARANYTLLEWEV